MNADVKKMKKVRTLNWDNMTTFAGYRPRPLNAFAASLLKRIGNWRGRGRAILNRRGRGDRRKRLVAALAAGFVLVLLIAAIWIWRDPAILFGRPVTMTKSGDLLIVSGKHYEIAFSASDGGIHYIRGALHNGERQTLSLGNRAGALWWAFADGDAGMSWHAAAQSMSAATPSSETEAASADLAAPAPAFSYRWRDRAQQLAFRYGGPLQVEATFAFEADGRIRMQADVYNGTTQTLSSFQFPYELKFDAGQVNDGLLPLLPGARLTAAFFTESNSYEAPYPGTMFAAYEAIRTDSGIVALYDVHGAIVETTKLGFKNQVDDAGRTALVHGYSVAIAPHSKWRTPEIALEIGDGDYEASIRAYGELNGLDQLPSLADKLGEELPVYASLPFYKTDISAIKDASWQKLRTEIVGRLAYPGVLHLVGFQHGGHDENYPDFWPPDLQWGTPADFEQFVQAAHRRGNKLVPYTNFSWWGVRAPTLERLPDGVKLEDISVIRSNGLPIREDYGPHSGYVINPAHPFVRERIAQEHERLLNEAGFDGIFEDQWGIRDMPAMYNAVAPDGTHAANAYFQSVRDYFTDLKMKLYTENGIDVLAGDTVGFMGTNYLWDMLGYRSNTAPYAEYYPMAGMLLRDKVMLFQHDLAAETMTDNRDMLRWNMAMGYNLSVDLYNGAANPWVDLVAIMQREVLSEYVHEKVTGFALLDSNATRTDFETRVVTANWNHASPYRMDETTTLSPGGFDVQAADGRVRAGNYVRYNGFDLDPGEHMLIEVRSDDAIRVYQPFGADTTVQVRAGEDWPHTVAAAYEADGTKIADLPVVQEAEHVRFDYIAVLTERKVAYVELTASEEPSSAVPGQFRKVKLQTNLALGRSVRSTTDTADTFSADKAVDGDPYTYWESIANKFPQSLTVDLGAEESVDRLLLRLVPQDAWELREQEIEVLGSADGQTFRTVLASQAYTFDPAAENKADIPLERPEKLRYIRLTIASNTAWPAAQVSEIEVYGGETAE